MVSAKVAQTVVDAFIRSLDAALVPGDGMLPPVALLWTDGDAQWAEWVASLRSGLPNLFTLGEYNPGARTGPAIWLRCVVDRTLPDVWAASSPTPVVYLPRVERQALRAGGDCPPELQPLVELQYRGAVWHQRNGRDWTVEAFLTSEDGCGLDVARDSQTKAAMLRVLPRLADVPLESLRGRRLTADDFHKLAVPDAQRDLLVWMHDPQAFRASHTDGEWSAFRNLVRTGYGLDLEEDGPPEAARRLLEGAGAWAQLWQRFTEAPTRYRGVAKLLREPMTGQGFLVDRAKLPVENEEDEQRLRDALAKATKLPHREACDRVLALEAEHGMRRGWVWRYLDESPFAVSLEPLARLASSPRSGLAGNSAEELAAAYAADGWRCDDAALASLASAEAPSQRALVADVVRALYLPWLDKVARQFQDAVSRSGGKLLASPTGPLEPGTCLLFADGLRFDLGARLQAALEAQGVMARLAYRLAPVPAVTATAKPLATPLAEDIAGDSPTDFNPLLTSTNQPVTAQRLRDALASRGIEVLDADEIRMPSSADACAWMEVGRIDELGHKLGDDLAHQVEQEIDRLRDAVTSLLDAGWRRVRVVTDHGWLLLPGGFPKVDLPAYLVESRWARCAAVREGGTPDVATFSWYWNPSVRIASPPGAGAYSKGNGYAHGGLSPQECVVPELTVERGAAVVSAKISSVEWKRLRCVVSVSSNDPTVHVDVRSKWKQADTSLIVAPKAVGDAGQVSLAVRDESEGQAAMVLVLDATGQVLDKRSTIVGGE